ncbi:MAG: hypothetical protein QNJ40_09945 [Xanthomonadales bacterium]|nr:hypothetical protein [Xanthomonadales bacterium]
MPAVQESVKHRVRSQQGIPRKVQGTRIKGGQVDEARRNGSNQPVGAQVQHVERCEIPELRRNSTGDLIALQLDQAGEVAEGRRQHAEYLG